MERIYADYAATSPLGPGVREAMLPWLDVYYGNPSSLHAEGLRAKMAIDEAREVLSEALGCLFAECVFTSCGTEAANMAILGTALAAVGSPRKRILLGAAEHHCVLHTEKTLARLGFQVELVPVTRHAVIDLDALEAMVREDVLLVSLMLANNEVGTIQPVSKASSIARSKGALFHCDAVQGFGVLDFTVDSLGADLLSVSAHKLGGPKGVGALYVRAGTPLAPWIVGGGQERELRAGTENVAGIVGFAAAIRACSKPSTSMYPAAEAFRSGVEGHSELTVSRDLACLPGIVHVRFPGVQAETLLIRLDRMGVAASAGAACSSGSLEPSHVLLACGLGEVAAKEGVRFSFGPNQPGEVGRQCAERVMHAVESIQASADGQ